MAVNVNKNGEVIVLKTVKLEEEKMRKLIKTVVTDENTYSGDLAHERWTVLYNAYDLYYGTNIRELHESYNQRIGHKVSRLAFMISEGFFNQLFFIASKVYKNQFEIYVEDYI